MSGILRIGITQRLIALLCAIALGASASGVLPALSVLVGNLDADHEISVRSRAGQVEVRFHHHDETALTDLHHHENGSEAQPFATATDSHDDHVIKFAPLNDSIVPRAAAGSMSKVSVLALLETGPRVSVLRDYRPMLYARPPPGPPRAARCLRSVVLLV